jgi:hypothetical protein
MTEIKIPEHLSGNRRYRGLPVPRVVAASARGRIVLAPSTWNNYDLMTMWEAEDGPPDFGKYDEELQRRSVAECWCHVCGRKEKELLICAPSDPSQITVAGSAVYVCVQPWVCAPCLAFSILVCGPIRKAIKENRGAVFANIDHAGIVQTRWKPALPEDPVPPEGARVLSAHKIMLRGERGKYPCVQTLPLWASTVARRYHRKWSRDSGLETLQSP